MRKTGDIERTIARRAALVLAVATPVLAAAGFHQVAFGSLAGTVFGLASFHLLGTAIIAALSRGPTRAPVAAGVRYLARYVLTALVLYAALRANTGVFLGAAAGMIMVKLVILLTGILGPL
ncbi:MAG: ATP synthase subunit I [Firmicutes bacterium]|jgi:hypothetical protein|nr:ATP synthase subunit I [Bacillota bacterium]MDH7495681.1 ATP synthase subunit I [Bacillota bacterium]